MSLPAHGYPVKNGLVIPGHEIWFEFSHARGPGGQNVNKVASAATLCFAPAASGVLSDREKKLAEIRLANRIGSDGVIRITSRESRSQADNRALAALRFCRILAAALETRKKRNATQPTRASRERRLADKRARSLRKADRKPDREDEG